MRREFEYAFEKQAQELQQQKEENGKISKRHMQGELGYKEQAIRLNSQVEGLTDTIG
jgi:hypothetical protein